jgi:F-type H+-transporting ATPase subunit b
MDIDVTIVIQLVLFLIVLVTLTQILFRPFLNILEERHQKIHGTKAEVDRLERLAAENQAAYVARVREARNVARQERDAMRAAGNEEKRKLLAEARAEIAQALNETREQVAKSESEARKSLSDDNQALARQLVAKVVGREVSP